MTTTVPPEALRLIYADQLAQADAIRSPEWHAAFAAVPRETFVPTYTVRTPDGLSTHRGDDPAALPTVYSDTSLITQQDEHGTATSSSSQPTVMAHMLEALGVQPGQRVLEIGSGTGYNTALLAHRLGDRNVYSIDVDPALTDAARAALHRVGYAPALTTGDGMQGWPGHAPYDALIATCGFGRIPDAWRQQVSPGGVMVVPIGLGLVRLVVAADHSAAGTFLPIPAAFMTARASAAPGSGPARLRAAELAGATGRSRQVALPADLGAQMAQFLGALAQPDVEELLFDVESSRPVRCLVHQPTGSWARITPGPGDVAQLDHGGPRDLWAEREPLLAGWVQAGQPPMGQVELHVAADGAHQVMLGSVRWTLPGQ